MRKILEAETCVILHWFRMNCMKSNDDKYKLIVANTNVSLTMGNVTIEASASVKLLGVNMDNELKLVITYSGVRKKCSRVLIRTPPNTNFERCGCPNKFLGVQTGQNKL